VTRAGTDGMMPAEHAAPASAGWHWWLPGLLALIATLTGLGSLQRLDLLALDLLSSIAPSAEQAPASAPAVIAIDERSLQQLGRWPWSRRTYARLLDRLQAAPPKSIAFGILFDLPDSQDMDADSSFAAAIGRSGRVVLPVTPVTDGDDAGLRAALPATELASAAAALGHVDVEIDRDGLLRRTYLTAGVGSSRSSRSSHWSALPQAAAELGQATARALPGLRNDARSAEAKDNTWRRDHELLLRLDPGRRIDQFSFVDVLNDPALATHLADRVVFVGVTAAGIASGFATTATRHGGLMPAVEWHARTFEALEAGDVITPLSRPMIMLLTLIVLGAGILTHRRYQRTVPGVELLVIGLPLLISLALLVFARYWYPPIGATLALAAGYLLWAAARFRITWSDLFLTRRRAEVTLNAVADGVVSVDRDGRIEFVNPVGQTLLGRDAATLRGQTIEDALAAANGAAAALRHALTRCFDERGTIHVAEPIKLGGSSGPVVRVVVGPILGTGRKVEGAVLALSDISEAVAASERLHHQASHDALTDLPNRLLVRDRIEQSIAGALRNDTSVGVLFIDLDDFKRINDSFGHQIGDRVLCSVASRLKSACRGSDTVGRWGGDEFVIMLVELPTADAIEIVARKLLAALAEPMVIDGTSFHLTATIGISRGPQDSRNPDELLGMADTAMYRVKQRGGGSYGFASAAMTLLSRQRMEIENGLRAALKNDELVVFYQPQIRIDGGTLSGFEALVRWDRPGHGLLLPGTFVPVAEESDLILQLGNWVLDEVARQIRQWIDDGLAVVPVAINISARQCLGHGLVRMVSAALEKHGIPPWLLELEITETTAMQDVEHVESLLGQIEALGIRVALDDFGTGYSSLSHLRRFPITVLKIDQSFVLGVTDNADDGAIVRATIALAHNLGLKVIGEGVETDGQRDFLAAQGCDIAQGYCYGRPSPATAARDLLAACGHTGTPGNPAG
jgi:diguanylate cyclase (GGDEF)-like protein/PAS domain S-box-containing protein